MITSCGAPIPDALRLRAAAEAARVAENYAERQELAPALVYLAQAVQHLAEAFTDLK